MAKSWSLSPSAELDEAITWFKRRVSMPETWHDAARDNARRTGFWMARVATAQRATRIQRSLEDAMAHGMDFDTWRKNNVGILKRIPRAHLQTAFRNWSQTALNNARIDYLLNPQVRKRRPYWLFDATLDANTTAACSACNGTVLEAGHKWFLSHTPPLHHNCRSNIRGLTRRQAEKLGIRRRAPLSKKTAPDGGFGKAIVSPWKPSTKDIPAGLRPESRPAWIDEDGRRMAAKALKNVQPKKKTPSRADKLVSAIGAKGGIIEAGNYLREGMRSMVTIRKAFQGLSAKDATDVATGKREVVSGGSGLLEPIRVLVERNELTGETRLYLKDGRHRATAAAEAGATHIRAEMTEARILKNGEAKSFAPVVRIIKL